MVGEHIERAQHQIHQRCGDRHRPFAHIREQRFKHMGKGLQGRKAESARAALDRMDRAEDAVDRVGILRSGLARGQTRFGGGQRFLAFDEEDVLDFLGCHAGLRSNSVVSRPSAALPRSARARGDLRARRCARADQQLQHGLADLLGPAGVDLQGLVPSAACIRATAPRRRPGRSGRAVE
jgi:hypothetical protein